MEAISDKGKWKKGEKGKKKMKQIVRNKTTWGEGGNTNREGGREAGKV